MSASPLPPVYTARDNAGWKLGVTYRPKNTGLDLRATGFVIRCQGRDLPQSPDAWFDLSTETGEILRTGALTFVIKVTPAQLVAALRGAASRIITLQILLEQPSDDPVDLGNIMLRIEKGTVR